MSAPAFRYFKKTLRRKFSRVPSSKALFFTKRISQSDVRETWHHLCRAAASAEHPFSPEYIGRNWKEDEYLARLVQLGSERGHTATLRTSPQMTAVVSRLLEDVTASAKGKSENLAYSALHYPRPSPKTLVDSLNRLHPFKDAEFRPMIAQVLKLGIRMGVWPDMVPGPFIYAFNARIALLFVNARCVVLSENVKRIDLDDAFQNLSTKVEELVISYAFQHLTSSNESSYSVRAQAVYGVRP